MTQTYRGTLAATTALCLLMSAGAAWGQQADSDAKATEYGGDIVVTAQKREERLLDVPAAISVIGAAQLEQFKASQLTDIAAQVPALQINSAGTPGQTIISIRGIAPLGASATVGTYIDEAPVGSSSIYARSAGFAADLLPYDIQRIEVLKGPQGTLYGASSIGGLLKYVTKAPDLNAFEARAGGDIFDIASAGDIGYAGRVGINVPVVTDKLAIRGSYAYQHTPGYVDNVVSGQKDINRFNQQSARLALLWQASERFSLKLSGLWQQVDAKNNASIAQTIPAEYLTGTAPIPPGSLIPIGDGRSGNTQLPERFKKDFYYFTATADLDLDFANLISATSYAHAKTKQRTDASHVYGVLFPLFGAPAGLSAFQIGLDLKKWTQELRLTSSGGTPFEWMFGGFYTHEKSGNEQLVTAQDRTGAPIPSLHPLATAALPSTYQEYALFGEVGYTFADVFELNGGLRWARNEQDFRQISGGAILPTANTPGTSAESVWTWSVSGRYKLGERASLYARAASGYRPGGPNVVLPNVPPTVGSDELVNYELGVKADVLGGAATIEAAVFLMDWSKIQLSVNRNGVTYADNAGSARAKGFELSTSFRPTRGLSIGINAAYTDARLRADAPSVNGFKGNRLPLIPKFSSSVSADYSTELGGDWKGNIGAAFRFVGDRYSAVTGDTNTIKAADYTALDANIGVSNDRWSFRLFAKNLTDSRGLLNSDLETSGTGARVFVRSIPIQPRTIGLALDLTF